MDDPRPVFKYRFERLKLLLEGGPELQLFDISAILRQFLIDSPNLVDLANETPRLRIRYKVFRSATEYAEANAMPGTISTTVFSGTIWPPFAPLKEINRDEFLAFDLIYVNGQKFTVKHIVKFCANQVGGVHFEKDTDDPDFQILRSLNNVFQLGDVSSVLSTLMLIGRITILALDDLYNRTCHDLSA